MATQRATAAKVACPTLGQKQLPHCPRVPRWHCYPPPQHWQQPTAPADQCASMSAALLQLQVQVHAYAAANDSAGVG